MSNPLENAAVIRVMDAEYKKSLKRLENLTNTTINQATHIDLINMLDETDLRVSEGVQSYSAAVCDILDRYAGKGMEVSYPTGAKRTLESAVRMVVVTSMNQTAAQITNQYIVEGNIEYVLVSAHSNARTGSKGQPAFSSYMGWQGLPYKIVGSEPGFPNLEEKTGYRIDPKTGQGTVTHITALHGVNCRHGHRPWSKELKNPWRDKEGNLLDGAGNRLDDETVKKNYQLSQKQRYMERSIRATKRRLIEKQEQINNPREDMDVGKLQKEYDSIAFRMTQQNKAYNDFCKQNDLQPQYDRIKVADFGREQTKRSNVGAKRYQSNNIENSKENLEKNNVSDTIKLSEQEQHALNKYMSSESYVLNDKLRRGIKLSADEQKLVNNLDSALVKMPEYKGTVYRSVSDFGIEDVGAFIKSHTVDEVKVFSTYISTSKTVYDESFPIQYVIESKHGRDISALNLQEQEILFNRNSVFIINRIEENIIYMEEL